MEARCLLAVVLTFGLVGTTVACANEDVDRDQLLAHELQSQTEDELRGGNCQKSNAPHCADAGTPDAAADATPTVTTCSSFTYSAYGACQPNGTQTRTVATSSPSGCTGGTPVLSQSCTYIDGAALYTTYCAGCHGTSKKGSSATNIQAAIDTNRGGMGSLSFLTAAQIAAIAAAP